MAKTKRKKRCYCYIRRFTSGPHKGEVFDMGCSFFKRAARDLARREQKRGPKNLTKPRLFVNKSNQC